MKHFVPVVIFLFCLINVSGVKGQSTLSAAGLQTLNLYQDTLRRLNDSLLDSRDEMVRQNACYQFIRKLIAALKTEGSFHYAFDSLSRISVLNAPDRSFRIFNWALRFDNGTYRYYGSIQMNRQDKLILFPFFDYSPFFRNPMDSIANNEKWFGALYYRMMEVKSTSGKSYYMLFGWDGNDSLSNKKILEVLTFNSKKQPVFGAAIFDYGKYDDRNKRKRVILEYNKSAKCTLNFDEELQLITFDHLVPESGNPQAPFSNYVPDGTYEGFKWDKVKWRWVENVFTSVQSEPPFPNPVDFDKQKKLYKSKK